jgi:hypothetical protein
VRTRIGIGIGTDRIRAVVVRRGRILFAIENVRDPDGPLSEAVEAMLARLPRHARSRPSLHVAFGPAASQIKRIDEIPAAVDAVALTGIIREGAASFFLHNGQQLSTAAGLRSPEGVVWAAAFNTADIDAIRVASERARCRVRAMAPTAVALGHALRNPTIVWFDAPFVLEIERSDGWIRSVRRRRELDGAPLESDLLPVPELDHLGDHAARFADAFGATRIAYGSPLSLGPQGLPVERNSERRGIRGALVLAMIAAVAAALSPATALMQANQAERERSALLDRPEWEAIARMSAAQAVMAETLDAVDRFADRRIHVLPVLAGAAAALPSRTALERIEVVGIEGHVVLLTDDPARALSQMRASPGFSDVEVVRRIGTSSTFGHGQLERVTLRFRVPERSGPVVELVP